MTRRATGKVELVPGVIGPRRITADRHQSFDGQLVAVDIRYDDGSRRYVCHSLTITRMTPEDAEEYDATPRPVTTETLRYLPVGQYVEATLRSGKERVISRADAMLGAATYWDDVQIVSELPNPDGREPWGVDPPEGLAGEGPTARVLEWVTHVYRYHTALSGNPTQAIVDTLGVPRATAGRWVSMARQRGHLEQTQPGKAGG